jgi:hypothetical protein
MSKTIEDDNLSKDQSKSKLGLEEGAYLFIDNNLIKLKNGYELMCQKLKETGQKLELPFNGCVENNFYG